jgi:hypothetical protein
MSYPGGAPQAMGPMNPGFDTMVMQFAPYIKSFIDWLGPLGNQPVVRVPYTMVNAASTTLLAGVTNQPLLQSDFQNGLEYPFEVRKVRFSQDRSHNTRDWRFANMDLTFNMPWQKAPAMIDTIINAETLEWDLVFPWVVRPKGGGLVPYVTNLDTVNPITIDIGFVGNLLLPRSNF